MKLYHKPHLSFKAVSKDYIIQLDAGCIWTPGGIIYYLGSAWDKIQRVVK